MYDISNGSVFDDLETWETLNLDFKVTSIDALDVLCAQLTRNLFAIAKFLLKLNKCFMNDVFR